MAGERGVRYIAPAALIATIVVTYLVVHGELAAKHRQPLRVNPVALHTRHHGTASPLYVVRDGDTLSGISLKTGVSLPMLETLNPNAQPDALQSGQRLRLR